MMSGSDELTTVDARIDTNMPRMRPERASSTWRWVMPFSAVVDLAGDVGSTADSAALVRDERDKRTPDFD